MPLNQPPTPSPTAPGRLTPAGNATATAPGGMIPTGSNGASGLSGTVSAGAASPANCGPLIAGSPTSSPGDVEPLPAHVPEVAPSDAAASYDIPRTIFVETNGNDSTAVVGNRSKPFASFGAAITAGIALGNNSMIEMGIGQWAFTATYPSCNYGGLIVGVGLGLTLLNIDGHGADGTGVGFANGNDGSADHPSESGHPGCSVSLRVRDLSLNIDTAGGNGVSGGVDSSSGLNYDSGNAGHGGAVTVECEGLCSVVVNSNAGQPGDSSGAYTVGGTVTLKNAAFASIASAGGSVLITNCEATDVLTLNENDPNNNNNNNNTNHGSVWVKSCKGVSVQGGLGRIDIFDSSYYSLSGSPIYDYDRTGNPTSDPSASSNTVIPF